MRYSTFGQTPGYNVYWENLKRVSDLKTIKHCLKVLDSSRIRSSEWPTEGGFLETSNDICRPSLVQIWPSDSRGWGEGGSRWLAFLCTRVYLDSHCALLIRTLGDRLKAYAEPTLERVSATQVRLRETDSQNCLLVNGF